MKKMSFLGERTDLAYEHLFLAYHSSLEKMEIRKWKELARTNVM